MNIRVIEAIVILILAVLLAGGGFIGGYKWKSSDEAKAVAQAKITQAKDMQKFTDSNATLASNAATLARQVNALEAIIVNQPTKERIVYVHPKPTTAKPTPAPVAITGPLYVTLGAVSLYNRSLGLPCVPAASCEYPTGSGSLSSAVTFSDYQQTALQNNVAALTNAHTVTQLWDYINALPCVKH